MWDRFPAPGLNPLVLISVGRNTVWAMDKYGEHYYREGVTETFPEGTKWLKIFGRVQSVSVSATDEVFMLYYRSVTKKLVTLSYDYISITSYVIFY